MDRRRFLQAAVATSVGSFLSQDSPILGGAAEAKSSAKHAGAFETIGLYCSLPTDPPPKDPQMYDFYKACGYNYLEFCEAGVKPCVSPAIPLLEPPALYLGRLKKRLEAIAAGNIGGVAPIRTSTRLNENLHPPGPRLEAFPAS